MTESEKDLKIAELEEWKKQALIGHNLMIRSIRIIEERAEDGDYEIHYLSEEDLQRVLKTYNIMILFLSKSNIQEDLINYLVIPFNRLLKQYNLN